MLTRHQLILTQLSEECGEVVKNVSKAIRFGPDEVYPKIGLSNAERITQEMEDLIGVFDMLVEEGVLPPVNPKNSYNKRFKVEEYIGYSKKLGIVE